MAPELSTIHRLSGKGGWRRRLVGGREEDSSSASFFNEDDPDSVCLLGLELVVLDSSEIMNFRSPILDDVD